MAEGSSYMSLEEVMEELQLAKAEIDQMVADNKLRPIRDAGKIKFRRKEVEGIKREAETEATVMFDSGAGPEADDESFDDGVFLVGGKEAPSSDDEVTIIGIPDAAEDESGTALFDDDETSNVAISAGSAEEDSDQTSIIPPSDEAKAAAKPEEEESIFDFGDEEPGVEGAAEAESDSVIIAAEPDSSSDIIEAAEPPSSSDIIEADQESSSDILNVSLADDESESAISLDSGEAEAPPGADTVSDILEMSDESDDALASVEVDAAGSDASTDSEEVVGDLLDTIDDGGADLLTEEEGLETADTIDLTAADDDATATVEEILDEDTEATEAGVLTEAVEAEATEAGVDVTEAGGAAPTMAAGAAMAADFMVPEEFVYGPPASHPIMTTVLIVALVAMVLSGAFLVNSVLGVDLPTTQWAAEMALKYFPK